MPIYGVPIYGMPIYGVRTTTQQPFFLNIQCPEEGSFVAYKKAQGYVVKLLIPDDAKRSSATSRKCRCDKAKVLEIMNLDKSLAKLTSVSSNYDPSFVYEVGETVTVLDFEEDRFIECAAGIHFFYHI